MSEKAAKSLEQVHSTSEPLEVSPTQDGKRHYVYHEDERKERFSQGSKAIAILSVVCAGAALVSDGYSNNVMTMLNKVYAFKYPKAYTGDMSASVSNASLVGTILGQFFVGFCCDLLSRRFCIIVGTVLIVLGFFLSAVAHGKTTQGMFWMIVVFRGVTGFGVGAEYPSSSLTASEAANEKIKRRSRAFILATNLPLSFGGPFASIVFLIVNKITKSHLNALWRTMFALGCFWPLIIFYFRIKMTDSVLFKKSAVRRPTPRFYWLSLKYYGLRLLGTCLCWFMYDFVAFSSGIYSSTIISAVVKNGGKGMAHQAYLEVLAEWQLLVGALALPGVFLGALVIDKLGRKYTMLIGFTGYIVIGLIVGCAFGPIKRKTAAFIVLYGLMASSGNFGPGNCLGLVSSESFATPIRGTFYGISAVIGKVGAVCGTKAFQKVLKIGTNSQSGVRWVFIIAACIGAAGVILTFLLIPNIRADDLLQEDIKFKNYLRNNDYHGQIGLTVEDDEQDLHSDETETDGDGEIQKLHM
ncbi:uncharacterized protein LODBEIA_P38200 [Lodderomyces beijingensis]|uniref:Major facilitator superfamily (MFS) profile domain-containing protein n=1 Tax=Lodderomyces beijingensis TaxID=1775926 RepID=A0ABP0ZN75_9ASCO